MVQAGPVVSLSLVLFMAPAPTSTAEWFDGHELQGACELLLDETRDQAGLPCIAFIQGFIAGTEITEATSAVDPSHAGDESYAERAARTRLGTLRMHRLQGTKSYCIDESVSAMDVVRKITSYLDEHPEASDLTAYDAVLEALVQDFPCNG